MKIKIIIGAAAELTASRNEEKYASIRGQYLFAPIEVKTLGPINMSACQLSANLGWKISSASGDERKGAFLFCGEFQCLCNAVLLHDTLSAPYCTQLCIILIFKLPREHIYRVYKNNNSNNAIYIALFSELQRRWEDSQLNEIKPVAKKKSL